MEDCDECLRFKYLLQESGRDYLAAVNRYNTLLGTKVDNSRAAEALRTARTANAELQRQMDEHVKTHSLPARVMVSQRAAV